MKANVGSLDRLIRLVLVAIISILVTNGLVSGSLATVLLIFAGILTITSFIGICPVYLFLKIETSNKN